MKCRNQIKALLLLTFLSTNCVFAAESDTDSHETASTVLHKITDEAVYFGAGTGLGSLSLWARIGWGICLVSPLASTIGNECLLISHLCGSAAQHLFAHMFKGAPSTTQFPIFNGILPSHSSWYDNHVRLTQIPMSSDEDKKLVHFLENRWLAKSTGFFYSIANWICPCFGVDLQIHPETTNHYARNPSVKLSQTYENRVAAWKRTLPQPDNFPLILTRPCGRVQDYLPSYFEVLQNEDLQVSLAKLALKIKNNDSKIIVDLTDIFSSQTSDRDTWIKTWESYQAQFVKACEENRLNPHQFLFIQRLEQREVGGIRLLPLATISAKAVERSHRSLLKWISHFGLSANRVELDRPDLPTNALIQDCHTASIPPKKQFKAEFVSFLKAFEQNWQSSHPQKTLMLKSTLQILEGLFASITEDKWSELTACPTRSAIIDLSILKIKEQLSFLAQNEEKSPFFDIASHVEQIHANLTSLLEIFSPFVAEDFPAIYHNLLTSIPVKLQPLTSCGIHTAGMTTVAGILKAAEKTSNSKPRVLFGENTYFECILNAEQVTNASSVLDANEEDWKQVDLLLAQFNPALKRIDLHPTEYKVEKIAELLHKALNARSEKPLTLALDCTLDFINSSRVGALLDEFQKEIESGKLNVICYRSGLKFDLFGMDNYCGAPFYMIHNRDSKWAAFDSLTNDLILQTDRLSLNWFCLAYKTVAPHLEQYRKQIFDNTRALLDKVPSRLFDAQSQYRIVHVEPDADATFVDIKISGAFHQLRGSALVGGSLYVRCMEGGHPIFYRPSIGFYHPNFTMIFGKDNTTIRLTLGLDPTQVDVLAKCFEMVDTLNGASPQTLLKLLQDIPAPALSHSNSAKKKETLNGCCRAF